MGSMQLQGEVFSDLSDDDADLDEPFSNGLIYHPAASSPTGSGEKRITKTENFLADRSESDPRRSSMRSQKTKRLKKKSSRLLNAANSMLHPGARAPPWYAGYQNSAQAPSHADREIGHRYGHAAILNYQRLEHGIVNKSIDRGITNVTLKNAMPKFRGENSFVDEYKDPLFGRPGAWPHGASYVTGSNLKPPEPTPEITPHLKVYMGKVREGVENLSSAILMQQREADMHRSAFLAARPSLEIDSKTGKPLNLSNELVTAMPRVRFWHGSTVLTEKTEDESALEKFVAKQQQQFHAMVALKWSESLHLYKLLRALSVQLRPGLEEFNSLLSDVQHATSGGHVWRKDSAESEGKVDDANGDENEVEAALSSAREEGGIPARSESKHSEGKESDGSESCKASRPSKLIDRETFVNVVCAHFEHGDRRRINKLYSGFDPHRLDGVDYRVIMGTQRCFWKYNNESIVDKLSSLFDIMDSCDRTGIISADEIITMLQVCAASEVDEQEMLQAAQVSLGKIVATHSLVSEPGFMHREELLHVLANPHAAAPLIEAFGRQLQARMDVLLPSVHGSLSPGLSKEKLESDTESKS
ncbi:Calcium-binding protein M [Hondaea fermentalgiana]|uniref:Calcium-binding protein M n=1 Tax=Hondaea fermentalgiana TaxID=2315210 RepID=A0A2R5GEJ7_9STRA|nr:Calcium-binding protein M [Hondaea fermentalgiana]|eukprot:GBG29370.1 Calcium-binding protein M [Hondaea fermentalgiana]